MRLLPSAPSLSTAVPPHLVPPRWTFQWVSSQQLRPLSSGESEQTTVGRVEEARFPAGHHMNPEPLKGSLWVFLLHTNGLDHDHIT